MGKTVAVLAYIGLLLFLSSAALGHAFILAMYSGVITALVLIGYGLYCAFKEKEDDSDD